MSSSLKSTYHDVYTSYHASNLHMISCVKSTHDFMPRCIVTLACARSLSHILAPSHTEASTR